MLLSFWNIFTKFSSSTVYYITTKKCFSTVTLYNYITDNKNNPWTTTNKCYVQFKVKGNILPTVHVSTSLHLIQKCNIEDKMKGNLLKLNPFHKDSFHVYPRVVCFWTPNSKGKLPNIIIWKTIHNLAQQRSHYTMNTFFAY